MKVRGTSSLSRSCKGTWVSMNESPFTASCRNHRVIFYCPVHAYREKLNLFPRMPLESNRRARTTVYQPFRAKKMVNTCNCFYTHGSGRSIDPTVVRPFSQAHTNLAGFIILQDTATQAPYTKPLWKTFHLKDKTFSSLIVVTVCFSGAHLKSIKPTHAPRAPAPARLTNTG